MYDYSRNLWFLTFYTWKKTYGWVPESLWEPHKSKVLIFFYKKLYSSLFFNSKEKNIFNFEKNLQKMKNSDFSKNDNFRFFQKWKILIFSKMKISRFIFGQNNETNDYRRIKKCHHRFRISNKIGTRFNFHSGDLFWNFRLQNLERRPQNLKPLNRYP